MQRKQPNSSSPWVWPQHLCNGVCLSVTRGAASSSKTHEEVCTCPQTPAYLEHFEDGDPERSLPEHKSFENQFRCSTTERGRHTYFKKRQMKQFLWHCVVSKHTFRAQSLTPTFTPQPQTMIKQPQSLHRERSKDLQSSHWNWVEVSSLRARRLVSHTKWQQILLRCQTITLLDLPVASHRPVFLSQSSQARIGKNDPITYRALGPKLSVVSHWMAWERFCSHEDLLDGCHGEFKCAISWPQEITHMHKQTHTHVRSPHLVASGPLFKHRTDRRKSWLESREPLQQTRGTFVVTMEGPLTAEQKFNKRLPDMMLHCKNLHSNLHLNLNSNLKQITCKLNQINYAQRDVKLPHLPVCI